MIAKQALLSQLPLIRERRAEYLKQMIDSSHKLTSNELFSRLVDTSSDVKALLELVDMLLSEQAKALKWLDNIASFAGERQRSATETEDFYLKGVHDADMAARKLVEMAKEEIEHVGSGVKAE